MKFDMNIQDTKLKNEIEDQSFIIKSSICNICARWKVKQKLLK